ncbi:hypothetical protein TTHERM_00836720 (macronuclear) [Tetrahymena thermophila SB210]|uniref:Uncharacterized protein n=1 Tax=Tetrahymena thermophila (strain SB210) TaxID=312017 RepID=I7MAP6_TETTS|nr:hypothetical protein TTHERM_00836720 [Tetrahymena thermophila SB210]EAS05000.2 hypothetical protein TTHERM_00836720 [Tetrahymena thermophila SB210]|eukprot:XP_001025245.2 hypothetical protein TTHERM_00836720 [Tetrahymena thermophila SB210]
MQDQITKKLKDSLNKSSESYNHLSNQSQGGINNQSLNFNNNNMNQNNPNADLTSQQTQSGNYMSNKLKKISQGANINDNSKYEAEKQFSGADQDSLVFQFLTNKLTQNLKDQYAQNGNTDTSESSDIVTRLKEFRDAQRSATQADQSDTLEQKYNQCQRLDTELNDKDAQDFDEEVDTDLILQQEFEALIQYERNKQELRISQQQQEQDSSININDQQQALQLQEQQQYLIQQQYLASLQPGDFRIEIENRFLKSDCNRNFQFPRNNLRHKIIKYDQDTDGQSSDNSSLLSVDGITVYNLHAQNMKNYQREYMQMQEQMNDQMEKFKAQEQLRLEKEEEEIIEKERLQHQLRQQKMVQQQVYIQHSYEKQNQERKNEQIQQLRQQFQQQQNTLLQMKQPGNHNINMSSQVVKTEAYDSDSVGRSTLTQNAQNQKQSQKVKEMIEQSKIQNNLKNKLEESINNIANQNNNNISGSNKKAQLQQKQQQLLYQGMKDSFSAEKQNSQKQQQLQKFKNILLNKQQNIQNTNKIQMNGNGRRMKTEGNDIDYDQQNLNNHNHHLHTQHNYQHEDGEEDETIENFELALQDDSDNDSGEVARLDDIKIQSYKQTASPPKNNNKSYNHQTSKSQNTNQENSNSKNYKNIMEILEKNSKNSHSRQSTSISNSNQITNSMTNNNQKKNPSQHSTHQTLQIQIQQAAAAAAAATINCNSVTKNLTYKSRPTTSQSNYYKNLYSSQNCSVNQPNQQSSNRNTLQPQDNNNISKVRQSSKTSHTNYDGNSTVQIGNHAKKPSGNYLNQSIENFSSKQPSINQTLQNQINPTQEHNSRKRSNSNKNNTSISVTSSIPNYNKLALSNNTQKQNIANSMNYSKNLESFKIDNGKNSTLKQRDEKAPSKAPTGQQNIMNLLSKGPYLNNNNNTNNSFQVAKNISMNQSISNKVNSQSYQNAAKLKGRNANSFHQNAQSSNISSIQTSQTTNLNNKSTIVSNYSINSNSKKKLLSSSSSSNLINVPSSINSQIKNDPKVKQSLQNNQISSIINANININNLNPTNYSKVRVSTNSNVRDSIQSQKGNALNSRVQTEPSNNDDDFDIHYLNNRLNTLQKIPSKQSLLNNKSSSRRKDNSSSKSNLRDYQFIQQQNQNYIHQKQQQIGQNQALQNLMINNSYNLQQKTEDNGLNQGQQIPYSQVKYADNLVKPLMNQQNIIHSNLRSTNEQSTSDLNDQNRLSGQSFDQIQKIRDYLKQKQSKYPTKQQNQVVNNTSQYPNNGINNQAVQYSYQQQQQALQKELQSNINQQQVAYINNLSQQQPQQHHLYQNFNQKSENQQFNQHNSQFNSNSIGQNNNQSYFQKQIR